MVNLPLAVKLFGNYGYVMN